MSTPSTWSGSTAERKVYRHWTLYNMFLSKSSTVIETSGQGECIPSNIFRSTSSQDTRPDTYTAEAEDGEQKQPHTQDDPEDKGNYKQTNKKTRTHNMDEMWKLIKNSKFK